MSKEEGFAHIFVLITILLVIGLIILIFLGIQAFRTLNSTPDQKAQYQNPFNQKSQYENPFETYQNPFNQVEK